MLQQKSRLTRQRLPIFCCPVLDCILTFFVFSWLCGLLLLHILVITSGYLSCYQLKAIWLWPLASSSRKLPLTRPFSVNSIEMVVWRKIPENCQFFLKKLKLTCLDQPVYTQGGSRCQIHLNHFSSLFWCSAWTSAGHLDHACIPNCTKPLPLDICITE